MSYLSTIKLPDEVTHFVFKVYGTKHYNMFCRPDSTKWTNGTVMLYSIDRMLPDDYQDFKKEFGYNPTINKNTAPWLISRGYDVFAFINKGWIANMSLYESDGYDKAQKEMDRMILKYQRQLAKEEEKLGKKEDSKVSLLERRSWSTFKEEELQPIGTTIYATGYGYCVYRVNEIGKLELKQEISHDGELIYEGKFFYRKHKDNYYLYRYENTEGIAINYDTIQNERFNNRRNF
jgi:hypothetical protein